MPTGCRIPSKDAKWWRNDRAGAQFHETVSDLDRALALLRSRFAPKFSRSAAWPDYRDSALEPGTRLGN
jgi:hypothetical protein